jgi:hypothetical protein
LREGREGGRKREEEVRGGGLELIGTVGEGDGRGWVGRGREGAVAIGQKKRFREEEEREQWQ